MRAAGLLLALVLAAPARAQFVESWMRSALSPTRPQPRLGVHAAIFPPQQVHLRFSHALHVEAEVACEMCHDAIGESARPVDRNIPAHAQCESCHDIDAAKKGEQTDPLSTCEACHAGHAGGEEVARNVFPAANVVFSHAAHLKRGAACADCHAGVERTQLATREHLPKMARCLACHDGAKAPNRCETCHLTEPDGRLRTRFASGTLAPSGTLRDDDHGRDFLRRHARVAQSDAESCSSCHRQAECVQCHAASSKAFRLHPPDFAQTHAVSARGLELDCQSCHRAQGFCVSCHQQTGAAKESRLRQPGTPLAAQSFHPPGFVRDSRGGLLRAGPEHHSFAAQANLQSCVSCHAEQTCLQCHATTGGTTNVSPHPPAFAESTGACRALEVAPVACAKCHGGGAGLASLRRRMPTCR